MNLYSFAMILISIINKKFIAITNFGIWHYCNTFTFLSADCYVGTKTYLFIRKGIDKIVVSTATTRGKLFQKYMNLQLSAQEYVKKIQIEIPKKDEKLKSLLVSLDRISRPHEELGQVNVAQITLNSKQIERISGDLRSYVSTLSSSALKSLIEENENGAPFIVNESKSVMETGESMANRDDFNIQSTNYLMAMTETQGMTGELEYYANAINVPENGRSILESLKGLWHRIKRMAGMVPGQAKEAAEAILEKVEAIPEKIVWAANIVRDKVISILKEISNLIRELIVALIGAMFELAAWIQDIATKKNFTISAFSIEIQPLEVSTVGPIPIPKFSTPKLTVSFSPKTNSQASNVEK